jgi:hypothetical protein
LIDRNPALTAPETGEVSLEAAIAVSLFNLTLEAEPAISVDSSPNGPWSWISKREGLRP